MCTEISQKCSIRQVAKIEPVLTATPHQIWVEADAKLVRLAAVGRAADRAHSGPLSERHRPSNPVILWRKSGHLACHQNRTKIIAARPRNAQTGAAGLGYPN